MKSCPAVLPVTSLANTPHRGRTYFYWVRGSTTEYVEVVEALGLHHTNSDDDGVNNGPPTVLSP